MILVIAGTKEGREIVNLLGQKGFQVMVTASTDYGKELASETTGEILPGELSGDSLNSVFEQRRIELVIDAAHPFATQPSQTVEVFCRNKMIPYVRFVREVVNIPEHPLIYPVNSWEEGVEIAYKLGNSVFLTTGSNNLEVFLEHPEAKGKRVVVRVLPDHKIVKKCQDLGLRPKDIIAMQGPFSKEMNRLMFKTFNAAVVVIKESGRAGGTDTKISAALDLRIPVVVIKRPALNWGNEVKNYQALLKIVASIFEDEVNRDENS